MNISIIVVDDNLPIVIFSVIKKQHYRKYKVEEYFLINKVEDINFCVMQM
jgi:hypothetical protein